VNEFLTERINDLTAILERLPAQATPARGREAGLLLARAAVAVDGAANRLEKLAARPPHRPRPPESPCGTGPPRAGRGRRAPRSSTF
jgi:hypothetical protein